MDWHIYAGIAVLTLGIIGLTSYIARPARGPLLQLYALLNRRPLVKPFEKRAREIYEQGESGKYELDERGDPRP